MKHLKRIEEGIFNFDKFKKKKTETESQPVEEKDFITKINGKEFHELSSEEKQNIPHEMWLALSPYVKRDCYHCAFLKAAISIWCTNDEAIAYRGTVFPGVYNCHFWQPNEEVIEESKKALNDLDKIIESLALKLKINTDYINHLFDFEDKKETLNTLSQLEEDIKKGGIPQALLTIVDMVGDNITPEEVSNLFTEVDVEQAKEELDKMMNI